MSSRANVSKRGSTWTYYVYVTGGDGRRRQVSKGGFRTRKEAEAARVRALSTLQNGTWVRPERVTVREFLEDEWLPTQAPPTLEESTYRSYRRYIRLHVVPYIGGIPLQQLKPMELTALYRQLLESGRRQPTPPARVHPPELGAMVDRLRAEGRTWQAIADEMAAAFPDAGGLTRHAVAGLHRRRHAPVEASSRPAGLKPRTVLYIHSIIHAALKDAMRWNRVARNVADAATPPPTGSTKRGQHTTWTGDQLRQFLDSIADDRYVTPWIFLATTGCRRGNGLGCSGW
ncbi:MAG: Arm DNA-binding domain-containing protein [Acidimicrobiia bacterium]